jgi:magnesium chelatase family protein
MLSRVYSCAVVGLEGVIVEVEVDYTNGLPGVVIVGLPDAAVQESRERVQTAVKNAGLHFPRHRIVVNLAPAVVRKEGPAYDLPIALGVIILAGYLPHESNGWQPCSSANSRSMASSVTPAAFCRWQPQPVPMDTSACSSPKWMRAEAALIPDLEVIPVKSLAHLYDHLAGRHSFSLINPQTVFSNPSSPPQTSPKSKDRNTSNARSKSPRQADIMFDGQEAPAAAKPLLARALPGILPEMSIEESLDVTRIYSVADQLPAGTPLIKHRPFRSPHHTISHAGLVGGGNIPKPGEISLAHRGVFFLDEFPEFGTRVLEVMRQPMEDKVVTISRAKGSLTFSANFQLIAAMNPCPCGFTETLKSPAPAPLLSSPNIKNASPVHYLTALTFTSKSHAWITKNSAVTELAKPARRFASECKLPETFNNQRFINSNPQDRSSATQICASGR